MSNETTTDTTAKDAGEGGAVVKATACVIRGALANAGCGQEVFLYTPEYSHPEDDELIYDQSAIDTLRAQLEAAEADAARNRVDAERYRWLRVNEQDRCDAFLAGAFEDLDAAIDAKAATP